MESVEQAVRELIATTLSISADTIYDDSNFSSDLGADSLSMVEIILSVEEHFDIDLDDAEPDTVQTVGELIDHVRSRLAQAHPTGMSKEMA